MPKDDLATSTAAGAIGTAIEITAETAHLVPPLLYRGFGYSYTDHTLYTAEGVTAALNQGHTRFFAVPGVCAETGGRALAMLAMRFCYPSHEVAELGLLLVDPAVSAMVSGPLIRRLTDCVINVVRDLAEHEGLRALISTEVTIHSLTQRLVGSFDFVTTGIYLGWTPAWGEHLRLLPSDRMVGGQGTRVQRLMTRRRTETVSVRPFLRRCLPYTVAPPAHFAPLLRNLYDQLKLPVTFIAPLPPAAPASAVEVRLDLRRSLAVIEVVTVGEDAVAAVRERFLHVRDGMIDLIHVVIPLTGIDSGPLVKAMLTLGCVWAALIPFYRGHDALVLQFLNGFEVDLQGPDLHSPLARQILQEIRGSGPDAESTP